MNIIPLKGIDELQFGLGHKSVKRLLGEPDFIEDVDINDQQFARVLMYNSLGLELYFDEYANFSLWGIGVTGRNAILFGIRPVGISEIELKNAFPRMDMDVISQHNKRLILPNQHVDFYLQRNVVMRIDLHARLF